ncbi:MAG TPA: hypothetical protein VHF22_04990 [Planctomycetota bacterium]|nr:hypothetical protein [Planctomycetota bacterium]
MTKPPDAAPDPLDRFLERARPEAPADAADRVLRGLDDAAIARALACGALELAARRALPWSAAAAALGLAALAASLHLAPVARPPRLPPLPRAPSLAEVVFAAPARPAPPEDR